MAQGQSNYDRVQEVLQYITSDIVQNAQKMATVQWYSDYVAPLLPDGVELPSSSYSYYSHSIELFIPPVEGRQWRGMSGTAGLIYKIRQALNIKRLERETVPLYNEQFQTVFKGYADIQNKSIYVRIVLTNQLPDNCTIVWEEEEQPARTVKKMRTVCGAPGLESE